MIKARPFLLLSENDPKNLKTISVKETLNVNLYLQVEMLNHITQDQGIASRELSLLKRN